jgi:hypothetical protein
MSMMSIMRFAVRAFLAGSIWLALASAGTAFEPDTDRVGSDIGPSHRVLNALACQKDCFANGQCRAWTFVNSPTSRGGGDCWLKDKVPLPSFTTCCVSGVRSTDFMIGNRYDSGLPPLVEFQPRYPDPLLCQSACYSNSACDFWSYTGPTSSGQAHVCKLFGQSLNPTGSPDPNSVVGNRPVDFEFDTDRNGSDMPNPSPVLGAPDPQLCRQTCIGTPGCRSFTFIKPWQRGLDAICALKNAAPAKSANGCCISGAVP